MAGETQDNVWPMPKFYFSVDLGDGETVSFQQVEGLESESQVIEYRHSNSPAFAPTKMPGIARVGNITMRKGMFTQSSKFWDWYEQIKMNTIERRTVTVALLDEVGDPKMTWTLNNAFPTKLTGSDLKAESNEIAIDTLELAYEKLTVAEK
ncbi:phage tail protein [Pontixanthobacter sp. CEM42]|uniref:phage tail protein n=1 Tax=Pontixanthobacter sp. CEM42 TaxID=2792077 RepID=UPI001ADF370B|nr:phage tail protein [Pontixanthobacter sp. CEM42]